MTVQRGVTTRAETLAIAIRVLGSLTIIREMHRERPARTIASLPFDRDGECVEMPVPADQCKHREFRSLQISKPGQRLGSLRTIPPNGPLHELPGSDC